MVRRFASFVSLSLSLSLSPLYFSATLEHFAKTQRFSETSPLFSPLFPTNSVKFSESEREKRGWEKTDFLSFFLSPSLSLSFYFVHYKPNKLARIKRLRIESKERREREEKRKKKKGRERKRGPRGRANIINQKLTHSQNVGS